MRNTYNIYTNQYYDPDMLNVLTESLMIFGRGGGYSFDQTKLDKFDISDEGILWMKKMYLLHGEIVPNCYGENFNTSCLPLIMQHQGYIKILGSNTESFKFTKKFMNLLDK